MFLKTILSQVYFKNISANKFCIICYIYFYHNSIDSESVPYMIFEYMIHGDLAELLRSRSPPIYGRLNKQESNLPNEIDSNGEHLEMNRVYIKIKLIFSTIFFLNIFTG